MADIQTQLPVKLTDNTNTVAITASSALQVDLSQTGANATAIKVDGSAVTQPVSGTVTANAGTGTFNVTGTGSAGSPASGVITVQGIASMTALKVDGSAVTQPVSGTVTANAGTGTFITGAVQPAATTGTITASAQTVSATTANTTGAIVSFNGTYSGVVVAFEVSDDGGTTWYAVSATLTDESVAATTATLGTNASTMFIVYYGAVTNFRIRSTAYTSGTANVRITTTSEAADPDVVANVVATTPTAYVDNSAFTDSVSKADAIAGYFNDSASTVTSGNEAAIRITNKRALHVNLRDNSGNEIGTSGTPIRIDPTGTTTQPVTGTGSAGTPASGVVTVQGITSMTPISVTVGQTSTGVVAFYGTVTSVGNNSTGTITYTVTAGKTFYLKQIVATSSGAPCKVVVDYGVGPTKIVTGFYASSSPQFQVHFDQPIPIAASTAVNIKITNNGGQAQDIYGFIGGIEV